ncbi:hypothetical protein [Flavobacterium sp. IB48]|uniref:hypothetical protein n=1 Tax=Flavobacterium sp. IB48 TaxID=2779375 RepID=UPI0018E8064A|nr:hypothetical protein [Flavobacterium sp. IB48]MBJ2125420.1 hypothetical protein [Flavobacterium sp. IB48]
MKRILLLLLIFMATRGFTQVFTSSKEPPIEIFVNGRYTFKKYGQIKNTSKEEVIDTIFNFEMQKNTSVVIQSLNQKDKYIYFRTDPESSYDLYGISVDNFTNYTQQRYRRYKSTEVGLYTIPFKLRGFGTDNFDFETNLSLLANLVVGFGTRQSQLSWFDASVGIGLSTISLDKINSNVTEPRTASALTLSAGGVFKFTSRANLGFFVGGDFLGKKDQSVNWKYNEKLWLGIGINISFNKLETDKPATKTTDGELRKLANSNEEMKNALKADKDRADKVTANALAKLNTTVSLDPNEKTKETQRIQTLNKEKKDKADEKIKEIEKANEVVEKEIERRKRWYKIWNWF